MTSSQNQLTIAQAITTDHHEIWGFYDQYVQNAGNVDALTRWANQLTWEISRHSIGEELVVYPMFEKYLGAAGQEMAARDRNDHQYVKDGLYRLEKMKPGTPEHATQMKDIIDHLKDHAINEEKNDLPALQQAISTQQSKDAAKRFERTKMLVPTRSHPNAPDKPPFETFVGLLAAPMDKLRDIFSKFPPDQEVEAVTAQAKQTIN